PVQVPSWMQWIQLDCSFKPVEGLRKTDHTDKQTAHMCSGVGIVRIQCHCLLIVLQRLSELSSKRLDKAKQQVGAIIGVVERHCLPCQLVGSLQVISGRIT